MAKIAVGARPILSHILHTVVVEILYVGIATRNHSSSWIIDRRWSFLVVRGGKAVGEIESHLIAEDAPGAGAGAVVAVGPFGEYRDGAGRDIASAVVVMMMGSDY